MPRQRNDAPLVSAHDYQTWIRWVFLKEFLQEEPDHANELLELARIHHNDVTAAGLFLDLEEWVSQFQFRLHPWTTWTRSAAYQIAQALNGSNVFVDLDDMSVISSKPTLDEVLQRAVVWNHRPLDRGSLLPGVYVPEMLEPPKLPYFLPQQPYEKEQKEYEILAQKVVHEFTEQVISMYTAGKRPKPTNRSNLNRGMKWLIWKIQGKAHGEIAKNDNFLGSESYIGKEIKRLMNEIGLQIVTREERT
jgi:hypothetical protein